MKPTKEKSNKFELIYDKLKLLNHKAYEMMISMRNDKNYEEEEKWDKHSLFIKDAMMIIDDGKGKDLTKQDFQKLNVMWSLCKHINV